MPTTRESLEAALAADPDNRTLHSAYADLLIEEGDPRGEYIRLELISGVVTRPDPERLEHEWLGPLYPFVLGIDRNDPSRDLIKIRWKLGWLDTVQISVIDPRLFYALRRCPVNRLIQRLTIDDPVIRDEPDSLRSCLQLLNDIPFRSLRIRGFESIGDRLVKLLERFLKRPRMFHLVLDRCGITDDGAQWLAHSRLAADLKSLRMPRNYLSPIGVAALAEAGFRVAERRTGPGWGADGD